MMLKGNVTHPEMIYALARAGHGSRVLITDSNYAADVLKSPRATRINLNLMPGKLLVTEIMQAVLSMVPIEHANSMQQDDGTDPDIVAAFRELLPTDVSIQSLNRADFYDKAQDDATSLVIVSGDSRLFANIILTIGYMEPDGTAHY